MKKQPHHVLILKRKRCAWPRRATSARSRTWCGCSAGSKRFVYVLGSTNLYGLFSHHHVQFLELVGLPIEKINNIAKVFQLHFSVIF